MSGPGLQINRNRGEDWFYNPPKVRRNHNHNQNQKNLHRTLSNVVKEGANCKEKNPVTSEQVDSPLSNVERFLEAITPSVQAQYLSKVAELSFPSLDIFINAIWF